MHDAIEYMYWALVSNMGILDDASNCFWNCKRMGTLQCFSFTIHGFVDLYLITDAQYKLPQLAPDGNYCPTPSAITEINTERNLIKYVDVFGRNTKLQ